MSDAKIASQWILVFIIWVSSIIAFSNSRPVAAKKEHPIERKLADGDSVLNFEISQFSSKLPLHSTGEIENHLNSDINITVISIDCGVNEDYTDTSTNIRYQADDISFVDSGNINNVSSIYTFDNEPQISQPLRSLRSFPDGKRNCYNLKPKQGINNNYLVRAYFAYGNYDGKDQIPIFDLYFGVNYWTTIDGLKKASVTLRVELVVYLSLTDVIDVCLVNTGQGVPFISLLEVWPLAESVYQTGSTLLPLELMTRRNLGVPGKRSFSRYTDDPFGRSWLNIGELENSESFNTSLAINTDNFTSDSYKLPKEVLRTAIMPRSPASSIYFGKPYHNYNNSFEYYTYLHFFDFKANAYQSRIMNILYNDGKSNEYVTLQRWSPQSLVLIFPKGSDIDFLVTATSKYQLPSMLNAFEIYRVLPQPLSPTDPDNVDAIRSIKSIYDITRPSWQGDPCIPINFIWEGLFCNSDKNPKVISLNLRSSTLSGEIATSFSSLTKLEILDLSNNTLTGEVPEFLAKLPNLKLLNLSGNKLTGSIPKALKDKTTTNNLLLSLDGNPGLCLTDSCSKSKSIITVVAATTASVVVFVIIVFVSVMLWRRKRNLQRARQATVSYEEVVLKSNNNQFTYSQILAITNDFDKMIGKGAFGTVYHGSLQDGTEVAVKLLSPKTPQSSNQFQTEAQLLMRVHHKNLASFLGYCNEHGHTAIIYEYMKYGNLEEYLTDAGREPLNWKQRIQIAVDAAQGLEYLHHGCKPPIVHRDIKTANILLNEKMQAKVADFGLSKFLPTGSESHILTAVAGTLGYLDPEYYTSSRLTEKSDVYSFGIVLLELITGQPAIIRGHENIHIVQWVSPSLERGDLQRIVDPRIWGDFDFGSMWKAVEAAIACVPSISIQRPSMSFVVAELKECLEMEAAREQTRGLHEKKQNFSLEMEVVDLETESGPGAR